MFQKLSTLANRLANSKIIAVRLTRVCIMRCTGQYFIEFFVFFSLMFLTRCIQHTKQNEENLKKTVTKEKKVETASQSLYLLSSIVAECSGTQTQMCSELKAPCLDCKFNYTCVYGKKLNVTCSPVDNKIKCEGDREFKREMTCSYCYQTNHWEHVCMLKANCNAVAAPRTFYRTNCTVNDDILCLGKRTFYKNLPCNWTGGYRWSTAVLLSITLGGFGADRFYLGHWQEGIGKLFSFGGLGVWTLIDVILISLRYLGPADGSLYI